MNLRKFNLALIVVIACAVFSGYPAANGQTATQKAGPVNAVQGIVAAFRQHPVVIIGEAHALKQAGDFYIRLVRDPSFQESVQDIVIEFASRNNQGLIDRYIGGDDVPMEEVKHIWRDTTKVASWESPIYAEWLGAIREVNKKLPAGRRLHVLAGDTAIDWSRIHNHDEWAALGDNNISIADVVVRQVLEKKHRALVVLGSNHVTKAGDRRGGENFTTRVESSHPGSTYVALLYGVATGWQDSNTEALLHSAEQNAPALYELAGSPLANGWLGKNADAVLYLGPRESLTEATPLAGSIEPEYLREVDRRSLLEWGELRVHKYLVPYTK
jgi:hypothetical protein